MSQTYHGRAKPVTAIVLAGGRGRRMQGQDKGLVDIAGRPLISYVIERVRPYVETVLVSANRNHDTYKALADAVIRDDPQIGEAYAGPLAGILAGLEQASTEYVLVIPCDTPCLPENLLPALLTTLKAEEAEIAYVHDGERDQQLIMLLRKELAPVLREWLLSGGRAVREWLATRRHSVVKFDKPSQFINLNTTEDCAAFARHGCN
ncbi:MAG: molybdenum cofactor guanylyltransferase MobA [Granulosicoccaceae bacterium]